MIRAELPPDASAAERWALETLVDLARLVPCDDPAADVVRLDAGEGDGLRVHDGRVSVGRRTLARVVEVAGAGAEQRSTAADRHGRVPASAHPLVREGKERTPEVQRHARDLREAVARAAGRRLVRVVAPWPEGRRWAAAFTHDLDVVTGWPVFTAARVLELARRGHIADAARVLGAAAGALLGDPVRAALEEVLRTEREHGIRSTWFVLVGDPSLRRWRRGDVTYRIEGAAGRACLAQIRAEGHEVGLHGSMETWTDAEAFRRERDRLGALTEVPPRGVRQHFLKMRPGATQRAMHQAGFDYDATVGFSDRNGFRLGVADVVGAWDDAAARPLPLALVPLHWMDRALSKYQGIEDPDRLVEDGLALAAVAREEQGLWVGLWHPNLAPALGYPGAPQAFARLAREVSRHTPWVAPLGEVVAWRRARRELRAAKVAPDGRFEPAPGAARPATPFQYLDGAGQVVA
ncbi:MAG TPA: hypothetical protein VFS07_03730 [Gemmatimonadales bacterium]|nr:hypothetical protein [Gemmatimonadales bacterium]